MGDKSKRALYDERMGDPAFRRRTEQRRRAQGAGGRNPRPGGAGALDKPYCVANFSVWTKPPPELCSAHARYLQATSDNVCAQPNIQLNISALILPWARPLLSRYVLFLTKCPKCIVSALLVPWARPLLFHCSAGLPTLQDTVGRKCRPSCGPSSSPRTQEF